MNQIQDQILELDDKMNRVYQMIETLTSQIEILVNQQNHQPYSQTHSQTYPQTPENSELIQESYNYSIEDEIMGENHHNPEFDAFMEHKDIIADSIRWESNTSSRYDRTLSSDLQIRRLTAQLTAAYNRIAALEEQLLSRRINH